MNKRPSASVEGVSLLDTDLEAVNIRKNRGEIIPMGKA
jgi:hypothetical protein